MSLIDRITGTTDENSLAGLFDKRAAAVAQLQDTIDQLGRDIQAVSELSDKIWRELPARPLSLPSTFGNKLLGRVQFYLFGATDGKLGSSSLNVHTTRQKPDLVHACDEDRKTLESLQTEKGGV